MRPITNDEAYIVAVNMCEQLGYNMTNIITSYEGIEYMDSLIKICNMIKLDDNNEIANIHEIPFVRAPDIIKK